MCKIACTILEPLCYSTLFRSGLTYENVQDEGPLCNGMHAARSTADTSPHLEGNVGGSTLAIHLCMSICTVRLSLMGSHPNKARQSADIPVAFRMPRMHCMNTIEQQCHYVSNYVHQPGVPSPTPSQRMTSLERELDSDDGLSRP